MEKHVLSKSTFIRGVQCLKSLYLNKKRPFLRDRLSDAQRAVFKRGTDVGILAQKLFPGGINLKPRSPALYRKKAEETMKIILNSNFHTLYEATFQQDQLLVILDILVKSKKGWTAYEVKSSMKISETFLLDAAFQYYVITHAGVTLDDFFLVFINPEYVLENELDLKKLFVKQSVLEEVKTRQQYIEKQIKTEKETLQATSSPNIAIGTHCYSPYPCDFLGHCWKKVVENSLLYLDAFSEEERFQKFYSGKDAPENLTTAGLNSRQKMQLDSAREKRAVKDKPKIDDFVSRHLQKPVLISAFFVRLAVPFLKGNRPYQLVPVAMLTKKTAYSKPETTFFISETNPVSSFKAFFGNLVENHTELVIYDDRDILEFLLQMGEKDLQEMTKNRLAALNTVFSEGMLFHYLLRSDLSPEHVSEVFFKSPAPHLNPSLLGMKWQQQLLTHNFKLTELKQNTEEFLYQMAIFHQNFINYLKNSK